MEARSSILPGLQAAAAVTGKEETDSKEPLSPISIPERYYGNMHIAQYSFHGGIATA